MLKKKLANKIFGFIARCEEKLVYRPYKIQNLDRNGMKMQTPTLPKFGIWILGKFDFQKNTKSAPQNLKFDCEFGIWDLEIHFQKSKINFSNSFRILFRDLKIWNQRCRKPLNLHFRFKILIFASNFSSTKILILY